MCRVECTHDNVTAAKFIRHVQTALSGAVPYMASPQAQETHRLTLLFFGNARSSVEWRNMPACMLRPFFRACLILYL